METLVKLTTALNKIDELERLHEENCIEIDKINARLSAYDVLAAKWGGAQTSFQKLQVTFTPAMKGPVKARIFVAVPNTTIYASPRLLLGAISSNRQYLIPGAGYINETGSTGGGGSTAYTFVG